MARSFKMTPSTVHGHATRTAQRGEQVSQAGSQAGSAGMHGEALGMVGGSTASRHQQLASQSQSTLSTAGSKLQSHSDQLHKTANDVTQTDSDHADKLRAIHGQGDKAPTPHAVSGSSSATGASSAKNGGWTDVGKMSDEEYDKFSPNWDKLMKTEPDKAWFWSGGHITDAKFDPKGTRIDPETGKPTTEAQYLGSIEQRTADLAKQHGGNTLEGLLRDNKIQMPGFSDKNPNAATMWKDASMTLARNAQGTVHVALPNTPGKSSGWANNGDNLASRRPENVFDMDEFPILRHNPNVTSIVVHDIDHGTQDTIWQRGE